MARLQRPRAAYVNEGRGAPQLAASLRRSGRLPGPGGGRHWQRRQQQSARRRRRRRAAHCAPHMGEGQLAAGWAPLPLLLLPPPRFPTSWAASCLGFFFFFFFLHGAGSSCVLLFSLGPQVAGHGMGWLRAGLRVSSSREGRKLSRLLWIFTVSCRALPPSSSLTPPQETRGSCVSFHLPRLLLCLAASRSPSRASPGAGAGHFLLSMARKFGWVF